MGFCRTNAVYTYSLYNITGIGRRYLRDFYCCNMYNPEGGRRESRDGTILNELYSPVVATFNSSERNIYYNYYCVHAFRYVDYGDEVIGDARGAISMAATDLTTTNLITTLS